VAGKSRGENQKIKKKRAKSLNRPSSTVWSSQKKKEKTKEKKKTGHGKKPREKSKANWPTELEVRGKINKTLAWR